MHCDLMGAEGVDNMLDASQCAYDFFTLNNIDEQSSLQASS